MGSLRKGTRFVSGPNERQRDAGYRTNAVIRVKFPDHIGWALGPQPVMMSTLDNGDVIVLTRHEWSHAVKPLLVQRNGEWTFAGIPAEVNHVSEKAKAGMERRWTEKNKAYRAYNERRRSERAAERSRELGSQSA